MDDEGNPTAFREIVNFYQEPKDKKWLSKYCVLNIKCYDDIDNDKFHYLGEP